MSKGRYFCGGSALAVTLALSMGATQALAQDKNTTTVDEVISTGTLIQGVGEEAALAVEVYNREDLLNSGSPSVQDFVRGLSEVGLSSGQSNRGLGGTADGVATINLRGLRAGRTLVLLNGVRLADEPSSSGGDVNTTGGAVQNINSIPMEVLSQVEVLKDGGGSVYGSDAVAGAVNFVTRRDLSGFEATANYTWIANTDGDYDLNIQWGKRGDNGNVLVSAFYQHQSPLRAADRDFTTRSFLLNGAAAGDANGPYQSDLGQYVFTNVSPNANTPISTIPGQYNGFTPIITATARDNAYDAGSAGQNDPAFGSSGQVRTDSCNQLGGFSGFNGTTPECYFLRADVENIKDTTDTYRLFSDLNYDITDTLRYHASMNFSKTNTLVQGRQLNANSSCDPWPTNANSYYSTLSQTAVTSTGVPGSPNYNPVAKDKNGVPGVNVTPAGTGSLSRACTTPGYLATQTSTGNTGGVLSVPGYNPAVRDYVLRYSDSAGGRVFSTTEINALTGCPGCNTTTFNGGSTTLPGDPNTRTATFNQFQLGQGYVPVQGVNAPAPRDANGNVIPATDQRYIPGQAGTVATGYGMVFLTDYAPFDALYNSALKDGQNFYVNQNVTFSVTQDIKGDLGEHFGNFLDFTGRATYSRNSSSSEGPGLMTDRLQRALNGFGTDLNDLGTTADGCTTAETAGVRKLRISPQYGSGTSIVAAVYQTVSGVPYTVGAGGGTDYDLNTPGTQIADFGFIPTALDSGNGCFFFNPFPSAIRVSRINGAKIQATATQVGFVGADTQAYGMGVGGDYQGYARGYGLENSPGLLAWLFQPMRTDTSSDSIDSQLTLNGTLSKFRLPGGDISWAGLVEYRYQLRLGTTNGLFNNTLQPCPYLTTVASAGTGGSAGAIGFSLQSQAADGLPANQNNVNATSTCSGTTGAESVVTGFSRPSGQGSRETVNHGIGGELNLPLLDNFNLHMSARYDEAKSPGATSFAGGSIFSADVKWQATSNFAFTANANQTSDAPTPDQASEVAMVGGGVNLLFTGVPGTGMALSATRSQVGNTDIQPETGFNWGGGTIFTTRDRRTQLRLQYFNDSVDNQPQQFAAATLSRVLTGNPVPNSNTDGNQILDCNDPVVQFLFDPKNAPAIFGGRPFVEYRNVEGDRLNHCVSPGDSVFDSATGGLSVVAGGMTIRGVNTNNNTQPITAADGTITQDPIYSDADDYGITALFPSRINSGGVASSGLDLNASHTFGQQVYGGELTLSADATWMLTSVQDATVYEGVRLRNATDLIGTQSSTLGSGPSGGTTNTIAGRANIFQGSISANYTRGKQNFYLSGRWTSPTADNSSLGTILAAVPASGTFNVNPSNPSICDTLNGGLGLPYSPQPLAVNAITTALGGLGNGEQAYHASCNVSNQASNYLSGQFVMDFSFRTSLPWDSSLSVTVNNLLDTNPPFQVYTFNYNPQGSLTPEGRTVKVSLNKKF